MEGKRRNTKAYQYMQEQLAASGFIRNASQINTKVKSLRLTYYRARDAVTRSGASRDVAHDICSFYDEMDSFMGDRPIAQPSILIRSAGNTTNVATILHIVT